MLHHNKQLSDRVMATTTAESLCLLEI